MKPYHTCPTILTGHFTLPNDVCKIARLVIFSNDSYQTPRSALGPRCLEL